MTEAPEKVWGVITPLHGTWQFNQNRFTVDSAKRHNWPCVEYVRSNIAAFAVTAANAEIARLRAQLDELGKAAVKEAGESGRCLLTSINTTARPKSPSNKGFYQGVRDDRSERSACICSCRRSHRRQRGDQKTAD